MNDSDEQPTLGKQLFLAAEERVAAIGSALLKEVDDSGFAVDTVARMDHGDHYHYYQVRVLPISERKYRRLEKKIARNRKKLDERLN